MRFIFLHLRMHCTLSSETINWKRSKWHLNNFQQSVRPKQSSLVFINAVNEKVSDRELKVLSFFEMKNGKMRTHTHTHLLIACADSQNGFIYVCLFWTLRKGKFTRSTCIIIIMLIVWWIDDIIMIHTRILLFVRVYLLILISLVNSAAKLYSINVMSPKRCNFFLSNLLYTNKPLLWISPAAGLKRRFALFCIRPSFWWSIHTAIMKWKSGRLLLPVREKNWNSFGKRMQCI